MNIDERKVKSPLRLRRVALEMRQNELARRLHVTSSAVSFWERHGIYTPRTARKVAAELGCDWRDLLETRPGKQSEGTIRFLTAARRKAGLCLREVAELLQVTAQTVQQHEKRGIRTARIAKRYAAVLGCDWKDLLD